MKVKKLNDLWEATKKSLPENGLLASWSCLLTSKSEATVPSFALVWKR